MKRGLLLLIFLAGGVAFSAFSPIARADDSANAITPGQSVDLKNLDLKDMDPRQRMLLLRKLHHLHNPGPRTFATAAPVTPEPVSAPAPAASASSSDASSAPDDSGNPYGSIMTRNVFALNPIPPPDANPPQQGPPPPKITLTGIMTIFGPKEALFNVAGVKRGDAPPHDESYIFTEGEEQDEVEVTTIDTNKNEVTFNNHGQTQVLQLTVGNASSGAAPSSPSWPNQNFRPRRFGRGGFGGGPPGGFQPSSYQPQSYNNSPSSWGNNGANNSTQSGGYSSGGNNSADNNGHNINDVSPALAGLSDEDQQAIIAANHAQMVQENNPLAGIMPPTQFDNEASQAAQQTGAEVPPTSRR